MTGRGYWLLAPPCPVRTEATYLSSSEALEPSLITHFHLRSTHRYVLFHRSGEDQARLMALWILCAKSVDVPLRNELLACSHIGRNHQTALLNLTDMNVPTARKVRAPHQAATDLPTFASCNP